MSATHTGEAMAQAGTDPSARGLGRPFAAQLTSTGLANLGDGVLQTLAPLVALGLTTSPAQISLLSAAAWLPWLLLGLAAGVLVDRVDRRRVQIGALTARASILAAGAALAATGNLTMPLLLAIALGYGITEVVADLGATSIVPDLVPTERLSLANGRIVAVQQVANSFLGAPLAGALIVVGAGLGFGVSAGLAVLAAVVLLVGLRGRFRHTPSPAPSSAGDAGGAGDAGDAGGAGDADATNGTSDVDGTATTSARASLRSSLADVREGLEYLFQHRVLRPLVIASSLLNMASTGYFAVFVLWVVGPTSHVGLTEAQYPLLMLGFAVGAVLGSLLAQRVQQRLGEVPTMLTTLVLNSLLLLAPLAIGNGLALGALLALVGMLNTIGNVVSMSLRQRIVPRHLLGRVGGAGRTLGYGLMPVGAVLGGLVAEQYGLPATFVAAVVLCLAACGYLALTVRQSMVAEPVSRP